MGTCWYLLPPVGTCWHLLVPVGTCWYLLVPVGTCRCDLPWAEIYGKSEKWFHKRRLTNSSIHSALRSQVAMNEKTSIVFEWKCSGSKARAQLLQRISLIFTTFVVKNSDLVAFVIFSVLTSTFHFCITRCFFFLHVRTISGKKSSEHDLFIFYLMTASFNKDCHQ